MVKAILWDIDGVVITKRHGYFSDRLAEEQHFPIDKITPFFKNEFTQCLVGKADLKKEIAGYLTSWNWPNSTEALLDNWFSSESGIDAEVLSLVDEMRAGGIKCFLASDQEKYRADYLLNKLQLIHHFDDHFFSYQLGHRKSSPEFFLQVLSKIATDPAQTIFIDDDEKNVSVATSLGIEGRVFTTSQDLADLPSLLSL